MRVRILKCMIRRVDGYGVVMSVTRGFCTGRTDVILSDLKSHQKTVKYKKMLKKNVKTRNKK